MTCSRRPAGNTKQAADGGRRPPSTACPLWTAACRQRTETLTNPESSCRRMPASVRRPVVRQTVRRIAVVPHSGCLSPYRCGRRPYRLVVDCPMSTGVIQPRPSVSNMNLCQNTHVCCIKTCKNRTITNRYWFNPFLKGQLPQIILQYRI